VWLLKCPRPLIDATDAKDFNLDVYLAEQLKYFKRDDFALT
jgi:hypothetical protein